MKSIRTQHGAKSRTFSHAVTTDSRGTYLPHHSSKSLHEYPVDSKEDNEHLRDEIETYVKYDV